MPLPDVFNCEWEACFVFNSVYVGIAEDSILVMILLLNQLDDSFTRRRKQGETDHLFALAASTYYFSHVFEGLLLIAARIITYGKAASRAMVKSFAPLGLVGFKKARVQRIPS